MSWTEDDIPDQSGRTALVTGANAGLGLETAGALAAKGAHVIMAARDLEKAERAERAVRAAHADASVEVRSLDLASLRSVTELADSIRADLDRIDLLINNAGIMGIPERVTEDGFEMQFGVNHLGHYALVAFLLPLIVDTEGARVVAVTSTARHFGRRVDPANPHLHGVYEPWRAYGQSKLANLHFAVGLEERLRAGGARAASLVAHPGLTRTNLQVYSVEQSGGGASQRFWEWMARNTGMSPARGARALIRAATDPDARGGQLYAPRFVNFGAAVRRPLVGRSRDPEAIEALFQASKQETGLDIDVPAALAEARR